MGIIDPSLGISVDFPEETFRNAVTFAMQMGTPPAINAQAVFVFKSTGRSYERLGVPVTNPRMDRDGRPLDPEVKTVEIPPRTVQVNCAIVMEAGARGVSTESPVGAFLGTRAVVTLLDDQYLLVKGCRELIFDGDHYLFGNERDVNGLFGVGIYTLVFNAIDEN